MVWFNASALDSHVAAIRHGCWSRAWRLALRDMVRFVDSCLLLPNEMLLRLLVASPDGASLADSTHERDRFGRVSVVG